MKIEEINQIKTIVTHGSCPDGMASAIILQTSSWCDDVKLLKHNTFEYLNLKATENMLFCDIIPPADRAQEFVEAGAWVLDHHITAKPIVEMFGERGIFADEQLEPGISGASLAFREVFVPLWKDIYGDGNSGSGRILYKDAQRFAELAGIRDTWQKDHIDFELASQQAAALTFYPWKHWEAKLDQEFYFPEEMEMGKIIYERRMARARKCVWDALILNLEGCRVAIFNDPDNLTSDVSEILRNENHVDVVAGFHYGSSPTQFPLIRFALRSDGQFNVGDMGKFYGGGGHVDSAGFTYFMDIQDTNPFLLFKDLHSKYVRSIHN